MQQAKSWTQWFEIPVLDFDRAKRFYEQIFDMEISEVFDAGTFKMGIFPHKDVGAAICWGAWYKPATDGVTVYLDANPDLIHVQNRIDAAGGKVLTPKKQISPEYGYMALFMDMEGNRLALHSKG